MPIANSYVSVAILGDGSVGKSSIIAQFKSYDFYPVYKQTIGCDFYEKTLRLPNQQVVSLQVWDIGGQSIHSKNLQQYIATANAIILVYDVTNAESFRNLDDWIVAIRKYTSDRGINNNTTSSSSSKPKPIYLCGNKVDLIQLRQISTEAHEAFICDQSLAGGLFSSARTGENIMKSFYRISAEMSGIKISEADLACYDAVLTAFVATSAVDEGRTEWADEIEAQDRALEEEKRRRDSLAGCGCAIS